MDGNNIAFFISLTFASLQLSVFALENNNMNFEEYQSEASQTALYPRRMENLEYPTLGLAGEAGEVANIVKKIQRDSGGVISDETRGTVHAIDATTMAESSTLDFGAPTRSLVVTAVAG